MFAEIKNGRVVGYDVDPCPDGEWLPVSQVTDGPFDPATHSLEPYDVRIEGGVVHQRARPVPRTVAAKDTTLEDRVAALERQLIDLITAHNESAEASSTLADLLRALDDRVSKITVRAAA